MLAKSSVGVHARIRGTSAGAVENNVHRDQTTVWQSYLVIFYHQYNNTNTNIFKNTPKLQNHTKCGNKLFVEQH